MYDMLKISLKFVPKGPINNIPALIQIMNILLMHKCFNRPPWVKVDLLAFWYSYDCPSFSEIILFHMIKLAITKPQKYRKGMNKLQHKSWYVFYKKMDW